MNFETEDGQVFLTNAGGTRVLIDEAGWVVTKWPIAHWFPESKWELLDRGEQELVLKNRKSGIENGYDLSRPGFDVARIYVRDGQMISQAPWRPGDPEPSSSPERRIKQAITWAESYGQTDGAHHKMWVIDQMLRSLLEDGYDAWVETYEDDGEYEWDTGIAP